MQPSLWLKLEGVTMKWIPNDGDKYYTICFNNEDYKSSNVLYSEIEYYNRRDAVSREAFENRCKNNLAFKTRKAADTKIKLIKQILKGTM